MTDDEIRKFLADPGADESLKDQIIAAGVAEVRAKMSEDVQSRRAAWSRVEADTPVVAAMGTATRKNRRWLDQVAKSGRCCVD